MAAPPFQFTGIEERNTPKSELLRVAGKPGPVVGFAGNIEVTSSGITSQASTISSPAFIDQHIYSVGRMRVCWTIKPSARATGQALTGIGGHRTR